MKNCPEIVLIPLNPREKPSGNVELLTLEEILDRYGMCAYESINKYLREQQESSPKHQELMKYIEDEVNKQLVEMLESFEETKS